MKLKRTPQDDAAELYMLAHGIKVHGVQEGFLLFDREEVDRLMTRTKISIPRVSLDEAERMRTRILQEHASKLLM